MSDKTNTNIKRSIKAKYSSIRNLLKENWVAYIALAISIILIIGNLKTEKSYRHSILDEINYARDMLDYTLLQRQQNIRTRPNFYLVYQNHIPESFADNLPLRNKLINLYQSLLSAQKSAEELMTLLSQKNSDSLTIRNVERQIERAIKLADFIGPQLAQYINKTWQIPLENISQQEKIQYYQNKILILNNTATDTNISKSWHKDK